MKTSHMTTQHYEELAEILFDYDADTDLIVFIAAELTRRHQNFNYKKFMAATGCD